MARKSPRNRYAVQYRDPKSRLPEEKNWYSVIRPDMELRTWPTRDAVDADPRVKELRQIWPDVKMLLVEPRPASQDPSMLRARQQVAATLPEDSAVRQQVLKGIVSLSSDRACKAASAAVDAAYEALENPDGPL